jgi:hypothetical protein
MNMQPRPSFGFGDCRGRPVRKGIAMPLVGRPLRGWSAHGTGFGSLMTVGDLSPGMGVVRARVQQGVS